MEMPRDAGSIPAASILGRIVKFRYSLNSSFRANAVYSPYISKSCLTFRVILYLVWQMRLPALPIDLRKAGFAARTRILPASFASSP
jgi:hypothetical protein